MATPERSAGQAPLASAASRIFGEEPLEPLSRRLLQVAGVLSVLLIAVVANAFLHSGENPLNPMAAAAEQTQSEPGARFTTKALYSSAAEGKGWLKLPARLRPQRRGNDGRRRR